MEEGSRSVDIGGQTKKTKIRPYKDPPCDIYGNPINEDGTVQAYVIPEWSSDNYNTAKPNIKIG